MFQSYFFLPLAQDMTGSVGSSQPARGPEAPAGAPPANVNPASGPAATSTSAPGSQPAASQPAADRPSPFNPANLILIAMVVVVGYLFLIRPQRKQESKRRTMLSEMKKGDRVMTIGGLIARVVSIDGDEVVLKVDESANVKETYSKKAIQEVLDRDDKDKK
jgi:preprotein translocase subunit YajC